VMQVLKSVSQKGSVGPGADLLARWIEDGARG